MMQANRTPVPMAVSSPSGGLHRHEHDGCPTTIVETNHSFEDSRAVGQGREVRAELGSAVVPSVRGQPGASVSVHSGVQPWNLPSPVMSAPEPSERNVEEQRRPSEPAEAAPRHRPGYIPAYGVVDDPPPRVLTITRPRRPPLTPLGRGRGPFKRVCVTDIPRGNPLYNIREFEFRAISGPRPDWGVGGGSSATSSTIIMSSTWASVVPAGTVPKDYPTISTASLPVLARRFLADPHEIGRFEGIGLDSWELGAAATRASVGSEPVTPEDCGSDCGSGVQSWARTPTGF